MAADKSHLASQAYNWGGVLNLPSTKDIVDAGYNWGGVLGLPSANDIVSAVSNSNTNYDNNSKGLGFANAAQNATTSNAVNLDHPAASGQAGLFYDDGIDWANPDLTYDIPADDMQANYEYEAYGGPRGPDWVFNPNATAPTSEPNRTPTTNPGGGGNRSGVAQAAPIPQNVLTSQNLFQRNPSGSVYAPDLSAYNDSSLFNYIGPGGVDEYTYGQDLPYQGAGYDIWGSPTNVPNPYYEGQFAPEPVITEPQGPADGAIGLPPVDMPAGVSPTNNNPNVGTNTTNINTGQDLTYAETLAEMGIDPADAPSTTFPSPGDTTAPIVNPGLTLSERQREQMGAENWDAMIAQANAWDNQMREGQLSNIGEEVDSGFKGEEELNKDVQKTTFDNEYFDTPILGNDIVTSPNETGDYLARDVAAGMLKNQQELQAKGQALQDMYDAQERIQTKDRVIDQQFDRNQAEYSAPLFQGDPIEAAIDLEYPGATQITDFVDAIDGDTNAYKKILAQDGQISKGKGATEPTADDYGVPLTMPQGLDDEFYANNQDSRRGPLQAKFSREVLDDLSSAVNLDKQDFYSADDRFRQIPQSIADVDYDARPMNLGDAAENANMSNAVNMQHPAYAAHQNRLENLFQNQETGFPIETRGYFAGSSADLDGAVNADKRTSLFDEQQNYQVPAEEISPGEVGLLNGVIEGLQNFGPNSNRTALEEKSWDKYNDYKSAGAEALNKGEIDERAFNELKGKAGASTVIDHFVDKGDHPVINSLFTNAANVLYQGAQTAFGPQTIAEGIKDIWQQGKGANDSTALGSVTEELDKAKKATQQRKEVQENIFTPGPLKYAAVARDSNPVIVKEDKPTRIPVVSSSSGNLGGRGSRAGRSAPVTTTFNRWGKRYGGR